MNPYIITLALTPLPAHAHHEGMLVAYAIPAAALLAPAAVMALSRVCAPLLRQTKHLRRTYSGDRHGMAEGKAEAGSDAGAHGGGVDGREEESPARSDAGESKSVSKQVD